MRALAVLTSSMLSLALAACTVAQDLGGGGGSPGGTGGGATTSGSATTSGGATTGGGATNRVITTLPGYPGPMVLDGDNLVLTVFHDRVPDMVPGSLVRVNIASGATTTLAGATADMDIRPVLVADASSFYFMAQRNGGTDGFIASLPRAGGTPKVLVDVGTSTVNGLAVGGGYLYWIDDSPVVSRVPLGGGTSATIPGTEGATSIAASDTALFWTSGDDSTGLPPNAGKVSSIPVGGGQVSVLADHRVTPWSISVSGSSVYWFDLGTGTTDCPTSPGDLATVPAAGGTVETLATVNGGLQFAVSGDTAFVAAGGMCNGAGRYTFSRVSGGATQVIAQVNAIGSIVIDGTHVYVDDITWTGPTIVIRELE